MQTFCNIVFRKMWALGFIMKIQIFCQEKFIDTKGVIRSRKSKKDWQHNGQKEKGQKDKQRSTKHYTENLRSSNTNLVKNLEWTQVFPWKG